jgi:hypothetical protein
MENVTIQILLMMLLSYLVKSKLIYILIITSSTTAIYTYRAYRSIFL